MMAAEVQVLNPGAQIAVAANEWEVTPSTSLSMPIASNTARSSTCVGRGYCTKMPSTDESPESWTTSATTSEDVAAHGSCTSRSTRPDSSHRTFFCLLYTSDAADDLLCVDLGGRRIIK